MLPLECPYLSRNAMQSIAGLQPLPVKHFALKRKPKSAALRADLLQKCTALLLITHTLCIHWLMNPVSLE